MVKQEQPCTGFWPIVLITNWHKEFLVEIQFGLTRVKHHCEILAFVMYVNVYFLFLFCRYNTRPGGT